MATFKVLFDIALAQESVFDALNSENVDKTLASFCVINQSWHCLAYLFQKLPIEHILKSTPKLGTLLNKLPHEYAQECELDQEFEQIVAWFQNHGNYDDAEDEQGMTLESVLKNLN